MLTAKPALRVIHPSVLQRLGKIRHVLFDFDGTLSVLRQGWEDVMVPMMVEAVCGPQLRPEIEQAVRDYVDRSSGILTIRQMQWLAETARRYNTTGEARTAGEYKAEYLKRLMVRVRRRIERLQRGETNPSDNMVAGSEAFVRGLAERGARLYLASGTDHGDVVREASVLGLLPYFEGGIYGALDNDENHAKERVIERILDENQLSGDQLLVVGDGPVEIREGQRRGALTLGVASDEVQRCGWNLRKVGRLVSAGADLLVPDFTFTERLIAFLLDPQMDVNDNLSFGWEDAP